jgi:hypothetical protein
MHRGACVILPDERLVMMMPESDEGLEKARAIMLRTNHRFVCPSGLIIDIRKIRHFS